MRYLIMLEQTEAGFAVQVPDKRDRNLWRHD